MKYEYLTNTDLEEARRLYLCDLAEAGLAPKTERISTADALGRITAEAVYARLSSPHYNACAMDGVALEAARTLGAAEGIPVRLTADEYTLVDTGDPLPPGCDAVVMIEDVIEAGQEGDILLHQPAVPFQHVRQIGEDIAAGDMLLPSYTAIEPAALGALLAGGVFELAVTKMPRVAILPTGDEVVAPSEHPAEGEVMEFNSAIFSGMLRTWGAVPAVYPIVKDDPALLRQALAKAAEESDAVLLIAGTSAGRDDGTAEAIASLGKVVLHGVAIKPGKPAVLGRIGSKPVLGTPGYPVSGILVLELLFKPILARITRNDALLEEPETPVRLSRRLVSSLKYREFVRASLQALPTGGYLAIPLNRGAGVVTGFVKADCILDLAQNAEGAEAGEPVPARLLRSKEHLAHTLSVIGSHDPLIDEAADLLRRAQPGLYVSSAHVGSMGGLSAVARGEAKLGGVHLLDASGDYNRSFVQKYCPGGVLIECVGRVQGLMVAKGNPLGVASIRDLPRLSYVNRQKGSGTRLLLDHLLKQEGIAAANIYGYGREEMTHTAVAAQIAAGHADAGLGIFSAASLYDLEFIPIAEETYDLVALEAALEDPLVKAFLAVLQGEEFSSRLKRMGGYTLNRPGRIRWKNA